MRVLFICNFGANRSRTAAEMFKDEFETSYKGIYSNHVQKEDMEWADLVVVMEQQQKTYLKKVFPKMPRVLCWNVSSSYGYKDPTLITLLKEKRQTLHI